MTGLFCEVDCFLQRVYFCLISIFLDGLCCDSSVGSLVSQKSFPKLHKMHFQNEAFAKYEKDPNVEY